MDPRLPTEPCAARDNARKAAPRDRTAKAVV
jgi:hypothetical protein